jgi:phosphatidylglycerophosphate synthase
LSALRPQHPSGPPRPPDLAFKAYEIEELADVYFFRPLGLVFARAARGLGLTPTAVTGVSVAVGAAGAVLLARPDLAPLGFALLIFYGVLDSSDGQLARMTGQSSELGRLLDGVGGYVVYAVIYIVLITAHPEVPLPLVAAAAASNVVHAQLYDYYRGAYADVAIHGRARPASGVPDAAWAAALLRGYTAVQRRLIGPHARVEEVLRERSSDGGVAEADRELYRRCFYRPVRGWNLLGDNTRFYIIGVLAAAGRLDWFFAALAVPLNAACAALWWWQARADRRFLSSL